MAQNSAAGFRPELLAFLSELRDNNNRAWFNANKQRYEEAVREPALDFVRAMAPRIAGISEQLRADDRRSGGSLMRIYRDTRFSRDKTPYKTNVGIQFRHVAGKDVHAPGFYVHIEPGAVFVGVGVWHPDSPSLAKIRARIDEQPARWRRTISDRGFARYFSLGGATLKRPPRGYAKDHPLIDDLKRKDFIAVSALEEGDVVDPRFTTLVMDRFGAARGFAKLICEALEVPF